MSQAYKSIPIGALDISSPTKDFIFITGWVLDAPLDPIKVENALAKLVDIWPVLSARLRTKPVSKPFTRKEARGSISCCSTISLGRLVGVPDTNKVFSKMSKIHL
ncbi:hypothetical protein FRC18_011461 [Serendipita sp. 400]|nr:hypothetical protein FRC18_011461 [Serendipita sp. 400]